MKGLKKFWKPCKKLTISTLHIMELKGLTMGSANAYLSVGLIYYLGKGAPKDHKEAMKCFLNAAEQGYVTTQVFLDMGDGVAHRIFGAMK